MDAIKYYLQHLVGSDNHAAALEDFKDIDSANEITILSLKMLSHVQLVLHQSDELTSAVDAKELPVVLFLKGAATILQRKTNVDPSFVDEFIEVSEMLCRRFKIFAEFGVKVSELDLTEPISTKRAQDLIKSDPTLFSARKLQQLSKLFQLPLESCIGHLLLSLADEKNVSGFVATVQEFVVNRNLTVTADLCGAVEKSVNIFFKYLQGEFCLSCFLSKESCFVAGRKAKC